MEYGSGRAWLTKVPAITSLLFFAVILILVIREQTLANRFGVAAKGDGPLGGQRAGYAWAGAAAAAIAIAGVGLSSLNGSSGETTTATVSSGGQSTQAPAQTVHPTTKLGNLTEFATITAAVLTSLRAGNPAQADRAATLKALTTTLDQFDGL